jgi:dipeptidyl aminopeptidase/acylaminoacyl peptidase
VSAVPLVLLMAACSGDPAVNRGARIAVERVDVTQRPILFASDRDGSFDVWLAKADGSDPAQLTTSSGDETFATWSPDGSQIAFSGSTGPDQDADLYVVGVDGTGLRRVTATDGQDENAPVWSPDGSRLLFTVTEPGEEFGTVQVIGVDGTGARSLAEDAAWGDWSLDGARIVYAAANESNPDEIRIRVMDADGSNQRTLGPESLVSPNEPTWSPDGRSIAFFASFGDPTSQNPAEWDYDLLVMNANGTGVRKVVDSEGNEHYLAAWSPDGRRLVYTADGFEMEGEIMSVEVRTGELAKLTDNTGQDVSADWRPRHGPATSGTSPPW